MPFYHPKKKRKREIKSRKIDKIKYKNLNIL